MGSSCLCLIASLATGLSDLVGCILADPTKSKYDIGGFQQLSIGITRMCGVLAASSVVSERTLMSILHDDRIARRIEHLDKVMQTELEGVVKLDTSALEVLARVCNSDAFTMRQDITRSSLIQAGYAESRLRAVRSLPWTLCRGDVEGNLEALRSGPRPSEETSGKIWDLLAMEYPIADIAAGVRLMAECSWTTTAVEQGHSSASSIIRAHPRYSRATLVTRSMVQQACPLFRREALQKKIKVCQKRVLRLQSKRPIVVTGRHAYCSALFAQARRWHKNRREVPADYHRRVIKHHGKVWAAMPAEHKQQFHRLARDLQEDRRTCASEKLLKQLGVLRELKEKEKTAKLEGAPCRLSGCRFEDHDIIDFLALYKSDQWTKTRLERLKDAAVAPVRQPAAALQAGLESIDIVASEGAPPAPEWARWMARHRDCFRGCVIRCDMEGQSSFFFFVFATQSPTLICFLKVEPLDVAEPRFSAATFRYHETEIWDWTFSWEKPHFFFTDDVALAGASNIAILSDVVLQDNKRCCADGDFAALEDVQSRWPVQAARDGAEGPGRRPKPVPVSEPWMSDPAMWAFVRDGGLDEKPPSGHGGQGAERDGSSDDNVSEGDDEDDYAAMARLWDRRAEVVPDMADRPEPFGYTLRGGIWTHRHHGVAFDSYRGLARCAESRFFCAAYRLPQSATFAIRKYKEEGCLMLCKAWESRLTFLFDLWCTAAMDPSYVFADNEVDRYMLPAEVRAFAGAAPAVFRERLAEIQSLKPRRPTGA